MKSSVWFLFVVWFKQTSYKDTFFLDGWRTLNTGCILDINDLFINLCRWDNSTVVMLTNKHCLWEVHSQTSVSKMMCYLGFKILWKKKKNLCRHRERRKNNRWWLVLSLVRRPKNSSNLIFCAAYEILWNRLLPLVHSCECNLLQCYYKLKK